jgi:hypothetical protein
MTKAVVAQQLPVPRRVGRVFDGITEGMRSYLGLRWSVQEAKRCRT